MNTTAEGNGTMLLDWLRALGWTVEIERDGEWWIGLARRPQAQGPELRVGGCAGAFSKLAWELFIGAVERLESCKREPVGELRAA